jgi:hypothetical protein
MRDSEKIYPDPMGKKAPDPGSESATLAVLWHNLLDKGKILRRLFKLGLFHRSLGIHWGTFKLTTEYYLEPPKLLETYLERNKLPSSCFRTTNIGGSVQP